MYEVLYDIQTTYLRKMRKYNTTPVSISILIALCILLCLSCGSDDEQHAHDSLIGTWSVVEGRVSFAQIENGIEIENGEVTSEGNLGTFQFARSTMDYQFKISETESLNTAYTFNVTKENAGFTRVDKYVVEAEEENWRVRFGDETSDAHCDATDITLTRSMETDTSRVTTFLHLVKS